MISTFFSIIGAITFVMGLAFIVLVYFSNEPHDDYESRKPPLNPEPSLDEVHGDVTRVR